MDELRTKRLGIVVVLELKVLLRGQSKEEKGEKNAECKGWVS